MRYYEISDVNSNIYRIVVCQAQPSPRMQCFLKLGCHKTMGFPVWRWQTSGIWGTPSFRHPISDASFCQHSVLSALVPTLPTDLQPGRHVTVLQLWRPPVSARYGYFGIFGCVLRGSRDVIPGYPMMSPNCYLVPAHLQELWGYLRVTFFWIPCGRFPAAKVIRNAKELWTIRGIQENNLCNETHCKHELT